MANHVIRIALHIALSRCLSLCKFETEQFFLQSERQLAHDKLTRHKLKGLRFACEHLGHPRPNIRRGDSIPRFFFVCLRTTNVWRTHCIILLYFHRAACAVPYYSNIIELHISSHCLAPDWLFFCYSPPCVTRLRRGQGPVVMFRSEISHHDGDDFDDFDGFNALQEVNKPPVARAGLVVRWALLRLEDFFFFSPARVETLPFFFFFKGDLLAGCFLYIFSCWFSCRFLYLIHFAGFNVLFGAFCEILCCCWYFSCSCASLFYASLLLNLVALLFLYE